jgi:hypothetical protein
MADENNGGHVPTKQNEGEIQGKGALKNAGVSAADIRAAIDGVTGAPTCGVVHDATPAIVKAIDELINGKPVVEQRVIKATETRKADTATA